MRSGDGFYNENTFFKDGCKSLILQQLIISRQVIKNKKIQ